MNQLLCCLLVTRGWYSSTAYSWWLGCGLYHYLQWFCSAAGWGRVLRGDRTTQIRLDKGRVNELVDVLELLVHAYVFTQ